MMLPPSPPRARAGITLTEILIGILIMGVGLISVASLFPLGLLRIRDAQRNQRSVLLVRSAESEVLARNLLDKSSFSLSWYGPFNSAFLTAGTANAVYDPFVFDPENPAQPFLNNPPLGVNRDPNLLFPQPAFGPGLPVAYDPLWWTVMYQRRVQAGQTPFTPANIDTAAGFQGAGRFGSGIGHVQGNPGDNGAPSVYGLQRLTNFVPFGLNWPLTFPATVPAAPAAVDVAGDIFVSQDDIVLQKDGLTTPAPGAGSPLLPDLTGGAPVNDWVYSWMLTVQQSDVHDHKVFDGSIVIFQNRPIGLVPVDGVPTPADERVVEAIFGYSPSVLPPGGPGYGVGDARVVLLRWPVTQEDPKGLGPGNWIADVTYERFQATTFGRFSQSQTPGQRCYWYRIAKVNPAEPDPINPSFRRKVVTLGNPVQAKTLVQVVPTNVPNQVSVQAVYTNVALINPSVINVISRTFYNR